MVDKWRSSRSWVADSHSSLVAPPGNQKTATSAVAATPAAVLPIQWGGAQRAGVLNPGGDLCGIKPWLWSLLALWPQAGYLTPLSQFPSLFNGNNKCTSLWQLLEWLTRVAMWKALRSASGRCGGQHWSRSWSHQSVKPDSMQNVWHEALQQLLRELRIDCFRHCHFLSPETRWRAWLLATIRIKGCTEVNGQA